MSLIVHTDPAWAPWRLTTVFNGELSAFLVPNDRVVVHLVEVLEHDQDDGTVRYSHRRRTDDELRHEVGALDLTEEERDAFERLLGDGEVRGEGQPCPST
jgi:hypothetical protein